MTGVFVLGALLPLYLTDWRSARRRWASSCRRSVSAVFSGNSGCRGCPPGRRRLASIVGFAGTAVMLFFRGSARSRSPCSACCSLRRSSRSGWCRCCPARWRPRPRPSSRVDVDRRGGRGRRIFGGGIAPAMGGYVAAHFGIQNILWLPMCAVMLGIVVSLLLKETAPAVLQRRMAAVQPELAAGEQSR